MNIGLSVRQFLDRLKESKLLSEEQVQRASPASSSSVDAPSFAESLVASGVLTSYQMEAVSNRKFEQLRIGNYDVLDRLGAGGMGTVYKARHRRMKRIVALKLLSNGLAHDDKFVRRFQREVEVVARLSHPNIVMAYDADEDNAGPFLVMECVDGDDLAALVQKNGPLDVPVAIDCILQAARGMDYAHSQGIIHRDIKPANLLRDVMGVVKVSDLGVARLNIIEGAADVSGITQAGGIVGSANYMSPEQAIDSTSIDHRADIYSLGATLYFLLLGRSPYQAKTMMSALLQHREAAIPSLADARKDAPLALDAIFRRMVAKAPADRYQTMAEVVQALEAVEASQSEQSGVTMIFSVKTPVAGSLSAGENIETGLEWAPSIAVESGERVTSVSSRTRQAELRQVTVLVCGCDLFESEAYLDDLDAEDQAHVLAAFQETCEQVVRRFGGTVVRCGVRGLVACFGYPVAYEYAASRAGEAGLSILEDIRLLGDQLSREQKLELNPWVGIHTGQAVVEARDGVVSLIGEASNVAVRLEDVATTGQIVCTEATHRLIVGHFRCASLGPRKIKGSVQPVELFHVQTVLETSNPIDSVERSWLTPLIGRDHEISLLKDRWEQAQEGMGQVVLVIGEAGLGKSRLVHTLKQYVKEQGDYSLDEPPVIEWRCSPHGQNSGLQPAIDFYERALGFSVEEAPKARFERMQNRLAQYGLARPETLPLWASLLSLPTPEQFPALSLSPARLREETFDVMLEWLHARATRQPILFVVEDLHWVDASTLEFLGQFLAEGLHDRVLTLLTFRPEFQTPWHALAHQTSLALNRLTRQQVSHLISKKTSRHLPEAVVDQIFDRTGGVPLFVEEFTKMVQESGLLNRDSEGDWARTSLAREIPGTLQDLVMARLDRLDGDRELAQLAAVLGREFSYELLLAVASLNEGVLQEELAKLVEAEILYQKGRPPHCTYTFKHALLEDALYNALIKSSRHKFHQRIGEVLEESFPQTVETRPELLAHHYTEAGLPHKAISFWLRAGLRSRLRSADTEAINHLTKGLSMLRTVKESTERDELELEFLTTLGPEYIAIRGYGAPEVGPIMLRARELCERIGDTQQLVGIMLGMWEWRLVRGDLRECEELAASGMRLAKRLNDPGILMETLLMPGATMFFLADFEGAREYFEKALASYEDREQTSFWSAYTGHNAGITHRCYLALVLWHLGFPDQALKVDREMRELALNIGHPFSMGHAVDHTAFLHHYCRLGMEVQMAAEEEIAIGTEQGFQLWHALGTLHKGAGKLLQSQRDEALPLLIEGLNAFRATGAQVRVPSYLCILGDAYTQFGRFEEAHNVLDEGLTIAERTGDRCHEAELLRVKGELLLAESPDQSAMAEDCFRRAIKTAQRQLSRAWELRATMSLAQLCQQQDRNDEAHIALAGIYEKYSEGFTTPDLIDAKKLLEELI
jgi:serine/threonine protein kinase/predicted ATPase/energy-coupling factor transporter ATP-binding protein EcfA2